MCVGRVWCVCVCVWGGGGGLGEEGSENQYFGGMKIFVDTMFWSILCLSVYFYKISCSMCLEDGGYSDIFIHT